MVDLRESDGGAPGRRGDVPVGQTDFFVGQVTARVVGPGVAGQLQGAGARVATANGEVSAPRATSLD
ncbi:hypothetical protein IL414_24755, partial [Escherichia coli]|uniref:hypothetical protein n=1 Tax=Escherichia coli TaxID=562 RepID=UPI0019321C38